MRLNVALLPDDGSGVKRFIGSCLDVTIQKQQEEELRRSQKMDALGKLTGGIAHDFNNMLGVILGYTEMLAMNVEDGSKLAKYAEEIYHAGERGAALTRKLLAFSRQQQTEPEIININAVLKDDQHMLEKTLTVRIGLKFQLADDLWPVSLDKGDLEDAILNLSINGMHAMPDGGTLMMTTENVHISPQESKILDVEQGDYVLLSISDTGVGMDEVTRSHIFEPFFTTKKDKGTGLGLSQVYGFVERSGGSIRVYTEPGEGTSMAMYFPRHYGQINANLDEQTDADELFRGKETILVVDDEVALLDLAKEILSHYGYHVLCANSAERALRLLSKEHVDLMISDVIMPKMDGYELATQVRDIYPNIKIQLASGFSDDRHRTVEDDVLHREILHKPYTTNNLINRVRILLDSDD